MDAAGDPAVRDMLARGFVVQVATLSPKQRPFLTPLWFVVDRGRLYIATGAASWAARNATANPSVALLFHDERGRSAAVLRLRGTASCRAGYPPWRVLARMAAKYFLAPRAMIVEARHARRWRLRRRYYRQAAGGPAYLEVRPDAATFLLPAPAGSGQPA